SQEQDDAEHDAEYECECCCDGGHIDRFISRLPDCIPLYIFKGEHFREFIDQLIHRSSTSTVTSWSASSAFSLPSVPSSTSIATNRWPYDSLFVRLMLPDSIFRSRSYFLTTCDTIGAFDCEPTNPNLRIFDVGNSSLTSSKDRAVSSSLISSLTKRFVTLCSGFWKSFSTGPVSTIRPFSITAARSHIFTDDMHLMGDEHDREVHFITDLHQQIEHFIRRFRLQGTCGFIAEKDFRFIGQGAGDADALFLPAGQLAWIVVLAARKPDQFHQFLHLFLPLSFRHSRNFPREADIFCNRSAPAPVEVLDYHGTFRALC